MCDGNDQELQRWLLALIIGDQTKKRGFTRTHDRRVAERYRED